MKISIKQITSFPVVAIALLFKLEDDRLGCSSLTNQRLPFWAKLWDDNNSKFGLNGPIKYQARELLDTDEKLSESHFLQHLHITFDREMEGDWVPKSKIYLLRLKWLTIDRYK